MEETIESLKIYKNNQPCIAGATEVVKVTSMLGYLTTVFENRRRIGDLRLKYYSTMEMVFDILTNSAGTAEVLSTGQDDANRHSLIEYCKELHMVSL